MKPMSLSEQLTYSTVLIHCKYNDNTEGGGTGFIMHLCNEFNTYVPVLITNKHVVFNSVSISIGFCRADDYGNPLDTEFVSFCFNQMNMNQIKCIQHPESNIDLCCILLSNIFNQLETKGEKIFYIPLTTNLIPTDSIIENLSAMEDIIMIGYPIGLSDQYNHKPVIRKGITASHPKKDYQGRPEILIDMSCYVGSSGSPVFIINQGAYTTSSGINIGDRIYLLGVLSSGPTYNAKGILSFSYISNVPTPITNIPINLGNIIKSYKILELENYIKQEVLK